MASLAQEYDVAISFLHSDEPLALQMHAKLSESLNVFVYSKKQEELAGTDGLESFRQVFRNSSRMVVVLYRNGWGKTPWTRVEEAAIKDRFLDQGWEWLLFVMLDEVSTPPVWLPKAEIRLNYYQYGFEQTIGATKLRAQRLGSTMRLETALDRAKRPEQQSLARAERDRLLSEKGFAAAKEEHRKVVQTLDSRIEQLNAELKKLKIERGFDGHAYTLRTEAVSINFYLYPTQPATQSRIVLQEFNGALLLPEEKGHRMHIPGCEPQVMSKREFYFDYDAACGWCWRRDKSVNEYLTPSGLTEHVLKRLLHLHDQFEMGKIKRRSLS